MICGATSHSGQAVEPDSIVIVRSGKNIFEPVSLWFNLNDRELGFSVFAQHCTTEDQIRSLTKPDADLVHATVNQVLASGFSVIWTPAKFPDSPGACGHCEIRSESFLKKNAAYRRERQKLLAIFGLYEEVNNA